MTITSNRCSAATGSCSSMRTPVTAVHHRAPCCSSRSHLHKQSLIAAQPDNKQSSNSKPATSSNAEEERLEKLEALTRGKRTANTPSNFKRSIPIRGISEEKVEDPTNMLADWKEGQLLPTDWDKMSWFVRINELYVGKRGVLFWANKSAYASVFIMIALWFAFRFVGPALGLYKLADL